VRYLSDNVAEGVIKADPQDIDRCGPGRCDFADLCRYRQRWMKGTL